MYLLSKYLTSYYPRVWDRKFKRSFDRDKEVEFPPPGGNPLGLLRKLKDKERVRGSDHQGIHIRIIDRL